MADFSAVWPHLLADYILTPFITMISCLLSIFVVLGNLLVVTAIWHENQLHTVTNYLIASLAAADCLVGALVMPFNIISEIILGAWTFGPTWCDLWHSFDVLASTASIMNLCAISLDRYLAITNPISYPTKMTPKRVAFLIVSIWTCSSLISFPAIVWWRAVSPSPLQEISRWPSSVRHRNLTTDTSEELQMDYDTRQVTTMSTKPPTTEYKCVFTDDTYYLLFSSFISFYGPLCVMLYAYYCIYRAAVQQTRFLEYGSKQVMVGNKKSDKRLRYLSELGASYTINGSADGPNEAASRPECSEISNGGPGGQHDRQRLVLRVHRGGTANLSNSTYKSNSEQQQQSSSSSSLVQKRNLVASIGSIKREGQTCDSLKQQNGLLSQQQAASKLRPQHSRRDELRVRCQRFDPSVTAVISSSTSGLDMNLSAARRQTQTSPASQCGPEREQDRNSPRGGSQPQQIMLMRGLTSDASDTTSGSRNSIITVEPREELQARKLNYGKRTILRPKAKWRSCRNMAATSQAGETDELLVSTCEALHRFKRTISLESALEVDRRRQRTCTSSTIGQRVILRLAAPMATPGDDQTMGQTEASRQMAPAYQDSDKLIRSIVDLGAMHYIDCAAATQTSPGDSQLQAQAREQQRQANSNSPTRNSTNSNSSTGRPQVQQTKGAAAGSQQRTRLSPTATSANQEQQQRQQQQNGKKLTKLAKERKAAKTLGIVVGVFILCWLPFFVVNIIVATCGIQCIYKPHILISIVTWLGWLNSAMNPVIYACWSRDFRRAFRKTLCTWVEFVCYDGANMARKLKLKKNSSYLNAQEAFLNKSAPGSFKNTSGCHQARVHTNLSSSCRSAVSIDIEVASGALATSSRQPSSEV